MNELSTCSYCGRKMCGVLSGSTVCESDLYKKTYTKQEILALQRDWEVSPCDVLCALADRCEQLIVGGWKTYYTPMLRGRDVTEYTAEENPEVTTPIYDGSHIQCAGYTPK